MTVWGADAVEAAPGELRVAPGDVVTPLAQERAAELGVRIISAPAVVATPARSATATSSTTSPLSTLPAAATTLGPPPPPAPSVSGALWRRGQSAPRGAPVRASSPGGRVLVVGAGHVGLVTASRLADADVFGEVVLVDVVDGLAAGIALDLTHTAGLSGYRTQVSGVTTIEEAGPADYVVVTAGRARQPGMSRADLVAVNARIVGDVAARVAAVAPGAVMVIVTNPLDEMTQHAWRVSGFPPDRVLGMAGVLDSARFRVLAAQAAGLRPDQVQAMALGSHGDEMVIPLSLATAQGRPLASVLGPDVTAAVVQRTRDSGAEVVRLLQQGSAFLAPGASAARMVLTMAADRGDVLPAAVLADGSYGIEGVYVGLPARLGPRGVREIVELPLTPAELAGLQQAGARIKERLGLLSGAAAS
jgi:malate dehydrogenase